jgi:hypothetical protein
MRAILIISVIYFNCIKVPAQYLPGAKQISMSNSDIALSNDVFALYSNPSGLSQMNWREVGIYYSPAPFGIKEISNGFAAYHEPTDYGSFSIGFMTYGFDLYRENKFTAGYSNNFSNKFFYGLSISYHTVSIKNYGNDNTVHFLLGGLVYLSNDLRLGFSVDNPSRATFGDEENQLPMLINSGLSYDVFDELTFNLALQKDIDLPASFRFGIDYLLIEHLNLRFGIDSEPARYSAGVGINYNIFSLDYAFFTHQDLGLTHQFGLIVHFGNTEPRTEKIRSNMNKGNKN